MSRPARGIVCPFSPHRTMGAAAAAAASESQRPISTNRRSRGHDREDAELGEENRLKWHTESPATTAGDLLLDCAAASRSGRFDFDKLQVLITLSVLK